MNIIGIFSRLIDGSSGIRVEFSKGDRIEIKSSEWNDRSNNLAINKLNKLIQKNKIIGMYSFEEQQRVQLKLVN